MAKRQPRASAWLTGQGMIWLLSGLLLYAIPRLFSTLPETLPAEQPVNGETTCHDSKVLDGDSVEAVCANQRLTLRLLGIDAPEMAQVPYGAQARDALARRLPSRFRAEIRGTDIYGRSLAVLYDSKGDINEWLLRQGFASVYRSAEAPVPYHEAEQAAKRDKRGVWRESGSQQNPQNWRRYHL